MEIKYTAYAEENAVKDRGISKRVIEDALQNPDDVMEGKKGRKIAHKLVKQKLLRVVYEEEAKTYIVVTAYYTSPQRYTKR